MARTYRSSDIFEPASYPEHTYVDRHFDERETYQERLHKALNTKGILSLITGASKSGKTVLCYSVIPVDKLVEVSGSHIRTIDDFWTQIAEKLQIPIEIETTNQLSNQKVLVIDDFHYIDPDLQRYIARVLKSEIFRGLKAVVVSLPHRSDDAIRLNPDLISRVRYINIEPWSPEELRQIPKRGFDLLGITTSGPVLDLLVQESITSPQLMQQNCLNLAFTLRIDEDLELADIPSPDTVHDAFIETTRDYENYNTVIRKLITGPPQGRDKRTTYALRSGEKLDIYHVILRMLAEDPPLVAIDNSEIVSRIIRILEPGEKTPTTLNISNTLSQIQRILQETGGMFQIMEWREQSLYVLDPFFLFYLRWSNSTKRNARD